MHILVLTYDLLYTQVDTEDDDDQTDVIKRLLIIRLAAKYLWY